MSLILACNVETYMECQVSYFETRRAIQYRCASDWYLFFNICNQTSYIWMRSADANAYLWCFGKDKYCVFDPVYGEVHDYNCMYALIYCMY